MAEAPPIETPPSTPAPDVAPPSGFEEAFGALDAIGRDHGTPEPPAQPPPGDGRVRGPDGKFVSKEKEPEKEKPADKPPVDDIDPTKLKTSELAKHYHKLKAEQKEWLKAKEDYEKKLKTPPEWPEKKTYEEKVADYERRLEEHNKRVADYERELQFSNFRKSQTYKDQYEKPLIDAYNLGQSETATLEIVERKDEEGNVTQAGRDATAADFDAVMRVTDNRAAVKLASQLFGDGAAVVLAHRRAVNEKNYLLNEAVKEYETKGAEREKTMREQQEKHSKEFTSMIDKFTNAAKEKYPAYFKPDPNNPKSAELLEKGSHLLNRVLQNGAPLKDGEKPMTGEEFAIAIAAVRNKAAAFDNVADLAVSRGRRIKELEKELAEFKASKPGMGNGNGRAAPPEDKDPSALIEAMGREH